MRASGSARTTVFLLTPTVPGTRFGSVCGGRARCSRRLGARAERRLGEILREMAEKGQWTRPGADQLPIGSIGSPSACSIRSHSRMQ